MDCSAKYQCIKSYTGLKKWYEIVVWGLQSLNLMSLPKIWQIYFRGNCSFEKLKMPVYNYNQERLNSFWKNNSLDIQSLHYLYIYIYIYVCVYIIYVCILYII